MDHKQFRPERIEFIRQKWQNHDPKLVVMYGLHDRKSWIEIAGQELNSGEPIKIGTTTAVLTPHPVTPGLSNQYWNDLARKLREKHLEA